MEQERKKRHGCLWAIVIFAAIGFLAAASVVGLTMIGTSFLRTSSVRDVGADDFPDLKETWSCGTGDVKVVRIPLEGVIMLGERGGSIFSAASSANEALASIHRASHDADVKAIVMEIDSGGGGITASDIIYKALMDFKAAQPGRKVVAIMGDVAASGALYVSLAADDIIAHPTTLTGSIGVILQTLNVRDLSQKIGVKDVTIKSGTNKDLLNPFEEVSPEQRQLLQGIIDSMYARFVKLVAERRNIPEDDVRQFADGRVFDATEALKLKTIDGIGYWEDAVAKTAELLGVPSVKVYRYEEHFSLSAFLKAAQAWDPVTAALSKAGHTRLLYSWQP